jgi:isopenicillin N synthase-like dioxygenase
MADPQAFTELPVIDVSALSDGTAEQKRVVAAELGRAAAAVGFFYVSGTGIASSAFDGLLAAAKALFALPMEEKMRSYIGLSRCHRGYVPEGEEVFNGGTIDHKEAFDAGPDLPDDDPDYLAGNPMVGPNQWPAAIPGFAAAVSAYYRDAMALGRRLLGALAVAVGEPEDTFSRYMTKPPSQLRLIHYPHDPDAADVPGIGAHTDYELITLLRPTSPGLEVLNGAGEWIDVPPRGDALVVNIGDMLELWSSGRYVATSHRVRKVTEERYSFPLFCTLDYHTVLGPLPRLLAPGEEPRPSLVVGEHLFAQTAQTFTYLKKRVAVGELALPAGSLALSSFGQEARQRPALSRPEAKDRLRPALAASVQTRRRSRKCAEARFMAVPGCPRVRQWNRAHATFVSRT